MTHSDRQSRNALAVGSWMLWIDSVGGYQLLEGDRFTVGGLGTSDPADITVRSAWRRKAATLQRIEDDFWLHWASGPSYESNPPVSCAAGGTSYVDPGSERQQVQWGRSLPITSRSSAPNAEPQLRLHKPSPLSRTVVVSLDAPHRFVKPVDAILLVDSTVLIGQASNHHIRTPQSLGETLVMSKRGEQWRIGRPGGSPIPIVDGQPIEIDTLVMTLRRETPDSQLGGLPGRENR